MVNVAKLLLSQLSANKTSSQQPSKQEIIRLLAENINQFAVRRPGLQWKSIMLDGRSQTVVVGEKTAYYAIPTRDRFLPTLEITECHCSQYLDRTEPNNMRERIERTVVDTVLSCRQELDKKYYFDYNYHDYHDYYPVSLINIGNDQLGILSILAKLYLNNYKNLQLVNLDLSAELNFLCTNTSKSYSKTMDSGFANCLATLFPKVNYQKIYYNQPADLHNSNLLAFINKLSIPGSKIIIFAEDLGNLGIDEYQSCNHANSYQQFITNHYYRKILNTNQYQQHIFMPAINNILTVLDRYIKTNQQVIVINYDGTTIADLSEFRGQKQLSITPRSNDLIHSKL